MPENTAPATDTMSKQAESLKKTTTGKPGSQPVSSATTTK